MRRIYVFWNCFVVWFLRFVRSFVRSVGRFFLFSTHTNTHWVRALFWFCWLLFIFWIVNCVLPVAFSEYVYTHKHTLAYIWLFLRFQWPFFKKKNNKCVYVCFFTQFLILCVLILALTQIRSQYFSSSLSFSSMFQDISSFSLDLP